MGHSVELDDGHRWGGAHPAVAIVPAVLAVAEREGKSFLELLAGIAVGYDAMCRLARATAPMHLDKGFHVTGTCGSVGAAAACAHLMGLDNAQMAYAISLGGLQSAGLCEMLNDNPGIKPIQPGKAAQAGVIAADLVSRGATAPRTVFEGRYGWLRAMCGDRYSLPALLDELGQRWEIMHNYIKLYPTCRHCHAAIDVAREARQVLGCWLEDIASVDVRMYRLGIDEIGGIVCPNSFEEAMFSLRFAVAIALETGNVTLQDYSAENLADDGLCEVARKVRVEPDEQMDALYPAERGVWMKVTLTDGRVFEKAVPVAKGEPDNPVSDEELFEKHRAMLQPYYDKDFARGLWDIAVRSDANSVRCDQIVDHFRRHMQPR